MKVTMGETGCLIIESENSLEYYALSKWSSDNLYTGEPVSQANVTVILHQEAKDW